MIRNGRARLTLAIALAASGMPGCGAASAADTATYGYDAQGRLVRVTHSGTASTANVQYTLDAAGNRKVVKVTGAP